MRKICSDNRDHFMGRTFTGWIAPAFGWRTYSITSSARASRLGRMSFNSHYCGMKVFPDGPTPVIWIITSPSFAQVKCGAFEVSE
jgi:hypothetical protein